MGIIFALALMIIRNHFLSGHSVVCDRLILIPSVITIGETYVLIVKITIFDIVVLISIFLKTISSQHR